LKRRRRTLSYWESGPHFSAMPHAQHYKRLIVHTVAQDIRPSPKGHRDFAPLSLLIHPTPQVWKLQEPLRPKLYGADSTFCSPGVPFAQELYSAGYRPALQGARRAS
jgi:hypothetical protein